MKLRNKKTGEIPDKIETIAYIQWSKMIMMVYINNDGERIVKQYDSLETFNEEWEDYEEPKGYWYINEFGTPTEITHTRENIYDKQRKNFGNYFETKEEAELAVRKLKAWKRLKDSKIKFCLDFAMNKIAFTYVIGKNTIVDAVDAERQLFENMKIIFGGEE